MDAGPCAPGVGGRGARLGAAAAGAAVERAVGLAEQAACEHPLREHVELEGLPGRLHAGHRSLVLDFRTEAGRAALGALLDVADVVIEASRPRALANLDLAPELISHRDGQVWLSITGYGRGQPDLVAFGDDAAVAGGLVGWHACDPPAGSSSHDICRQWGNREPVFCSDAIADPLTGVCGALAVTRSLAVGGGHLIDLSMREAAAAFAAAPPTDHGPHEITRDKTLDDAGLPMDTRQDQGPHKLSHDGTGWRVAGPYLGEQRAVAPPRRPEPAGHAAEVLGWLSRC